MMFEQSIATLNSNPLIKDKAANANKQEHKSKVLCIIIPKHHEKKLS